MMSSLVDSSTMRSFGEGGSVEGGPDAASAATPTVYRLVGSRLRVMLSELLAAVIAAFLVTQLAIFTTTVYLHRALTHRALTVHPLAAIPCRVVIWMTTGMRPREWVAVHRKHHASTDTSEDPHSPLVVGFWRVQLGNVGLYKRAARDDEMVRKYARDIPTERLDRIAFDFSFVGLGIGTTILVLAMWALGFGLLTGFV